MADLQKKADGKGISYPGTPNTGNSVLDSSTPGSKLYIFLNGGTVGGVAYPKVDMSVWDQATMCATCHVGGTTYEKDRQGVRLPWKTLTDMGSGDVNPFTSTVWESYAPDGTDISFATTAPWIYPQYNGNNPAKGPTLAPNGWGQVMTMKDPNTGASMPVVAGQLMMPNVKEMDCLFCHLKGYDNVMSSVMTQAGSLNAAPAAGAGLFDMTPISPTYMGYNGQNNTVAFTRNGAAFGPYSSMLSVSLTPDMVGKILAKPDSNNCMQCHATKTLKNMPEMFGVTGTSAGFLSSAPMIYDPAHAVGPLGKRMTAYDINAMWLGTGAVSPPVDFFNYMSYMMPGMPYTQANGKTPFNTSTSPYWLGGGNPGKTGPLYYFNDTATPDQNVLKRSVPVFARAEWFKRGDAWQDGQDVHSAFGCGGCHFTGDTTHKNQCDPGRGFDMASTIEDGVPHLVKGQLVTEKGGGFGLYSGLQTPDKHDTRNTVKRCEFCHVTGKDYYGNSIDTLGAPNPNAMHAKYGLAATTVQIADKMDTHGLPFPSAYGGQGVSAVTNFTTPNTKLGKGNHLDVMDCTVCHVQKKSMAVRALDSTSGMRYPSVVGTDPSKGMIGLFEDPAPDSFNAGAVNQYNGMFAGINTFFNYTGGEIKGTNGGPGYQNLIPAGTHVVGSSLQEWKPLNLWQKLGNMEAPLSMGNGVASQMNFRRKIYLANPISAFLWNNTDPAIDANGDSVNGGLLIGDNDELTRPAKASLVGYKDVFDGGPPDKNNTQGYGEPIYDPWIMHDLKAGMNFAPSALSVISAGYGSDPAHASAYDPTGLFTGAWKYVSVWSGAVVFTEPAEIHDYITHRNALEAAKPVALQKSWSGTQLSVAGAPFMVTHGVKPTSTYVKGGRDEMNTDGSIKVKHGCVDCHAPNAGFFNGGFTMTGTAIPADASFNPTSQLSAQDASGNYVRIPGLTGFTSPSNLMERPLEPYRIKALKGEITTFFEGFNKLGQPRSGKFQASDATYTWTTPMKRSDVLYPEEDGAIYYKIADTTVDGMPKALATPLNGQAYANYMETITDTASGIGIDPVAHFAVAIPSNVPKDTSIALSAADAQTYISAPAVYDTATPPVLVTPAVITSVGTSNYTWSYTDGTKNTDGSLISFPISTSQVSSVSFATTGTKTITLTVSDEEGKRAIAYASLQVVIPPMTVLPLTATHVVSKGFTFGAQPAGTTKLSVYWGDGTTASYTTSLTSAKNHTYATVGSKLMKVYAYSSTGAQLGSLSATITVN